MGFDRVGHDWLIAAFTGTFLTTLILTLSVARGWSAELDLRLFEALRHSSPLRPDGKPKRLTTAMRDMTALGGDTLRLLLLATCVLALGCDDRWETAAALLGIFTSARLGLFVLKAAVRRPRPPSDGGVVTYTSSFPSGHTFMAGVLFLAAAILLPTGQSTALTWFGIGFALVVSLLIGGTRMSFGIHWPSDVLVGWLAAIAWTSGALLLMPSGSM